MQSAALVQSTHKQINFYLLKTYFNKVYEKDQKEDVFFQTVLNLKNINKTYFHYIQKLMVFLDKTALIKSKYKNGNSQLFDYKFAKRPYA